MLQCAMSEAAGSRLVWIDMEMSGLDPRKCGILEIACIVTTNDLELVAEGPNIIVHQSDDVLGAMDKWCTDQHGKSGLTAAVRASSVNTARAQHMTLAFVREHCNKGSSPLCGNSIWQDRRFLCEHMPELEAFFHYRCVDVSSIKELCRRWYPGIELPKKADAHRALDDIRESIAELRFYRQRLFR